MCWLIVDEMVKFIISMSHIFLLISSHLQSTINHLISLTNYDFRLVGGEMGDDENSSLQIYYHKNHLPCHIIIHLMIYHVISFITFAKSDSSSSPSLSSEKTTHHQKYDDQQTSHNQSHYHT